MNRIDDLYIFPARDDLERPANVFKAAAEALSAMVVTTISRLPENRFAHETRAASPRSSPEIRRSRTYKRSVNARVTSYVDRRRATISLRRLRRAPSVAAK